MNYNEECCPEQIKRYQRIVVFQRLPYNTRITLELRVNKQSTQKSYTDGDVALLAAIAGSDCTHAHNQITHPEAKHAAMHYIFDPGCSRPADQLSLGFNRMQCIGQIAQLNSTSNPEENIIAEILP